MLRSLAALALFLTGCNSTAQTELDLGADRAGVRTETLTPRTYSISLDDLPAPYATESARKGPDVIGVPRDAALAVPEGFRVEVFAEGLDRPRWLQLTPDGDVLVTETRDNRIRRLRDLDGDGKADTAWAFATASNGLNIPFGMAFADGAFFLGNTDEVRRYPFAPGQATLDGEGTRITDLPGGGYNQHWTRNVVTNGEHLYVSVGSKSNVAPESPPRAAVLRMNFDGSARAVYASGLRNPVGLAFGPGGALYATVNERDKLGDGLVPDYFTRVQEGAFYGWPYAYLASNNVDPRRTEGDQANAPTSSLRR